MFFLTVGFKKIFVALFPRYGYLQVLAILRMREYSHTNVCYRYSNWDSLYSLDLRYAHVHAVGTTLRSNMIARVHAHAYT